MDMETKEYIYKNQFKYKTPFYYFVFNRFILVLFILDYYLFTIDIQSTFEKFLMYAISFYLIFSYLKGKEYLKDFINSSTNDKNLFIKFISKVKRYVYNKD